MGYHWRPGLPEDRLMDPPFFPMVNNWPYPYGTKGSWVSPEAALRHKWFGNFAGKMKEYARERNAHMIGEGVVAPPPCTPQPICQMLEVLTVAMDRRGHVVASLGSGHSQAEYDEADASCVSALSVSGAVLVAQLSSLLAGYTFYASVANTVHCWLHAAGCVGVVTLGVSVGDCGYVWYLLAAVGVPTLLLEAGSLAGLFWLRRSAF
ncbi:unnamed protein product [Prorocentrum cordatum]|uniref:Transmembrane protein 107 n=1 Tax=Prorocentrum cordatum TaxID=2364126 RepID=A0ABN9TXX5_9DINO|nr:unnamed protein product [Polarella glacialis]